jgi:class 3 adenylate cyclase
MSEAVRAVSRAELATEADVPEALVERLVDLGQLRPLPDGRFDARDGAVLATVRGLEGAGIGEDDVVWLVTNLGAGLGSVAQMFSTPAPRDAPTYRELRARLGDLGDRLPSLYAAFGLSEPEPDRPMRADEASVISRYVGIWAAVDPDGDSDRRMARLTGESSRRSMEAWLDAWDAAAQPQLATQGAPSHAGGPADPTDPAQNPTIGGAALIRELHAWLQERHFEQALNERIISAFEGGLVRSGRLPARPEVPIAVAFVDLTGYTTLTERLGDEAAAAAAARLAALADACVQAFGGRVVKLLGDGVLLRFDDAATAVRAVVDLMDEIAAAGLPPAHAGLAAGRIVTRDGDIFGRTVILASRIASRAEAGQLLAEEGVIAAIGADAIVGRSLGRVTLHGIAEPVELWLVST